MDTETNDLSKISPDASRKRDVRRLRILWIGLGMYLLIMLNAMRLADAVPYQVLILGGAINLAILATIIISIKRIYKRLGK